MTRHTPRGGPSREQRRQRVFVGLGPGGRRLKAPGASGLNARAAVPGGQMSAWVCCGAGRPAWGSSAPSARDRRGK